MKKSESIKELAKALLVFQTKCGKIVKESTNPFYGKKYASLSNILEGIREPLEEAKLSFAQFPDESSLTTILMHGESGEWIEASYLIESTKKDPQSIGSAITYARRYALGAILGLNIDVDDDGNAASTPPSTPTPSTPPPADTRAWLPDNKVEEAVSAIKNGTTTIDAILKKYKVNKEHMAKLKEA